MTQLYYGFIYDSITEQNALQRADIGKKLTTTTTPWLVYEDVANIVIDHWPVNLWFVEVSKAFTTSNKNYTPAITIKPLKQLPCSLLFGPKGEGICQLLDKIIQLNQQQVEQLAAFSNPLREDAYAGAWNTWLKESTKLTMHYDTDLTTTLAIGVGEEASPIYGGFLAVDHLFRQQAYKLVADDAFIKMPNTGDIYLVDIWRKACTVLLHMAMALGAEQYVVPQNLPFLLLGLEITNEQ